MPASSTDWLSSYIDKSIANSFNTQAIENGPVVTLDLPDFTKAGDSRMPGMDFNSGMPLFSQAPAGTDKGGMFDSLTSWFNGTRVVTVIVGLLLFGAGLFLLGKDDVISAVKTAVIK